MQSIWLYTKELFRRAPGLTACAVLMLSDVIFCIYGMRTDHTMITGIPAWDKPLKFALSTLVYAGSAAVVVRHTNVWPRWVRIVDVLAGLSLTLEIVIIDVQAFRHTTSHFNVATPLDTALWSAMGAGIAVLWLSSILITVATFRSHYHSNVRTLAVRWGMLIAILGMASGAFMAVPSEAQRKAVSGTHHLGGHTIGGVDGGPGLPFLNWSTQHGDVRPAHFAGMHALQVLFLLAILLEGSSLPERSAIRTMYCGIASYASLFLLILGEALLAAPLSLVSAASASAWLIWMGGSIALFGFALRPRRTAAQHTSLAGVHYES